MIGRSGSAGSGVSWAVSVSVVLCGVLLWPSSWAAGGGGSDAAYKEMQRLAANATKATYTVSYVTTFLDSHTVKKITSFRKGLKLRVDQGASRNFYDIATKTVTMCSLQGGKTSKYSCTPVPGMIGDDESFRDGEEDPSILGGRPSWAEVAEYAEVAPRQLLGVNARCFAISLVPDRILIVTHCLHPTSGVLLLGEGTGKGNIGARMKTDATAYSSNVTDADVTPPGR